MNSNPEDSNYKKKLKRKFLLENIQSKIENFNQTIDEDIELNLYCSFKKVRITAIDPLEPRIIFNKDKDRIGPEALNNAMSKASLNNQANEFGNNQEHEPTGNSEKKQSIEREDTISISKEKNAFDYLKLQSQKLAKKESKIKEIKLEKKKLEEEKHSKEATNSQLPQRDHHKPDSNQEDSEGSQSSSDSFSESGEDSSVEGKIKRRKVYSPEYKKEVMSYFARYNFALTVTKFAIPIGTLKTWITTFNKEGDEFFIDKRTFNGGKSLDEGDKALCEYITSLRSLYLLVTPAMVKQKALKYYQNTNFTASASWFENFLKKNKFAVRKKTHVVQQLKSCYQNDVKKYFEKLDEIRKKHHNVLFLNFDEVCIPFDLSQDKTLEKKRVKQVATLSHSKTKMTCTVGLCITSDKETFLPLILFKYKAKNRKYLKKYQAWVENNVKCVLRFSESGFNSRTIMAEYIEALKEYLAKKKIKDHVVLVIDSAPCPKGPEIHNAFKDTNIEIVIIPGGAPLSFNP